MSLVKLKPAIKESSWYNMQLQSLKWKKLHSFAILIYNSWQLYVAYHVNVSNVHSAYYGILLVCLLCFVIQMREKQYKSKLCRCSICTSDVTSMLGTKREIIQTQNCSLLNKRKEGLYGNHILYYFHTRK